MIRVKVIFYSGLFLSFLCASGLMLYFGKETFHVSSEQRKAEEFAYHFVLIPEEVDNAYWRLVEKGARDAAKVHGVYVDYIGPKQANREEHVKTFHAAIAGRVDGIMVQGGEDPALLELLAKAKQKGIPAVTVDTDSPKSSRAAYIGTNNYYAGFLAGQALLKDTSGSQYVGIVTGRFQSANQKLRVDGFKAAVQQEKRIQIMGIEESNITKIGAVEAAYRLMKQHPGITALYGTSALDAAGIAGVATYLRRDDMYVIGFDTLPETLALIKAEAVRASVTQNPYEMGYKAVESLVKIKNGESVEPLQHTPTRVIRKNDLVKEPV
nr:sugar-binding protein [Domibacillus indicus]